MDLVTDIDANIEAAKLRVEQEDRDNYHKTYDNNCHLRQLNRLYKMKKFIDLGMDCLPQQQGFLINTKFLVAWNKMKWRKAGGGKWYYYKKPQDFISKYT